MVKFLSTAIDRSSLTQREIALKIGYDKPNVISMFKCGAMRVPIEKTLHLADVLEIDPVMMFRLGIDGYWPEQWHVLEGPLAGATTANEKVVLAAFRDVTRNTDPEPPMDLERKLAAVFV